MKITLAKALKAKNRIVKKIAEVSQEIMTYNSVIKGKERPIDVESALKLRRDLVEALVALKLAIFNANAPIQGKIFENAELKGLITFLKGLNTETGVQERSWRFGSEEKMIEMEAAFSRQNAKDSIRNAEQLIDVNQDVLDKHNYVTEIEVPDNLEDLLKV